MKNRRNYYRILHVQPGAPTAVIRSSYRTLMQRLKMHPDLGGDHRDAALVNEAYAVLIDPSARAEYDASLAIAGNRTRRSNATTSGHRTDKAGQSTKNKWQPNSTSHCAFCHVQHNLGKNIAPDSVCAQCNSPLFRAEKQTLENSGQRAVKRIDKRWPVAFFTGWPPDRRRTGYTEDMSLNGMQLLTTEVLTEGQILSITSEAFDAVGRVANLRKNAGGSGRQWQAGLEFLTLRFHRPSGTFVSLEA